MDRKILIAGATSGIGLALAREMARRGWAVGAAGRHTAALLPLEKEFPGRVFAGYLDICSADAPAAMERLIALMGGMDVYCHMAGTGFDNPLLEPEAELLTVRTNVEGFTRMVGAAYRWMLRNNGGRGRIAAVTSVAGTDGISNMASYCASKCYQQTYLRALGQLARAEDNGIRFTDIRPGWVRTPLLEQGAGPAMEMALPYAVGRIARAIENGRRVAVVDWRWNLAVGLWRLVPRWLWVRLPLRVSGLKKPAGSGAERDSRK